MTFKFLREEAKKPANYKNPIKYAMSFFPKGRAVWSGYTSPERMGGGP